ncbi:MAG: hypothetical protein K6F99_10165 [Lachnospiraceae bacterium]|nr:hypothetical protein [Lachnospiraceae bacterium]
MNLKRILAWIAIILLAGLYISTLVFALIGSELTMKLLIISGFCTFAIPVLIHIFLMMLNIRSGHGIYDETYSYKTKKDDDKNDQQS